VLRGEALAFLPLLLVASDLEAGALAMLEPVDAPAYAWRLMLVHRERDAEDAGIGGVTAEAWELLGGGTRSGADR
jgi:hypothetical protein